MDVPEIDIAEAVERIAAGTPVIDVRELDEYLDGHVDGATHLALSTLPEHLTSVPAEGEVLIICRSGARSHRAAEFLRNAGVDAVNIAGGTLAWIDGGNPVVAGDEPSA